jgi:cytoskeletal protein RodZ
MAEIGSTLREARMRAHIDMSEVEASTKIRAKYLRAIENEEWDLLPGTVYVKSFLRTYGDYLGLDSRLLIDEFKRRYERPADHEVRPISAVGRERERASRRRPRASVALSPTAVIGAAILVIVVALYVIGSNSGSPTSPGGHVGAPAGAHGHSKHNASRGHGSRRRSNRGSSSTATGTTTALATDASLQLVPTGTVWVCVVGPRNKLLIPGVVYRAGQSIPRESATKLLVRLGNGNVTATVNGAPYRITRSAVAIGLKITATGAQPLLSAPLCS